MSIPLASKPRSNAHLLLSIADAMFTPSTAPVDDHSGTTRAPSRRRRQEFGALRRQIKAFSVMSPARLYSTSTE